jgi:A/G-specific adenine glycosylase
VSRGEALLAWYRSSARDLPWRRTTDPYRILLSEVMLQQTQAGRVVAHYERFLAAFPTVEALADASLAEVLDAWSGLGYHRRAAHLREAARRIAAEGWPTTAADLLSLPGVGPYTAAAVASFAFGEQVAAVDTNVRRVLSRWLGRPLRGRELDDAANAAVEGDAAAWNQAVMELGATRCRPRAPRCGGCPVAPWCADPTVYAPPPRQSPYEGSHREARSAVLRALGRHWASVDEVAAATGRDRRQIEGVLASLARDGLTVGEADRARLAD